MQSDSYRAWPWYSGLILQVKKGLSIFKYALCVTYTLRYYFHKITFLILFHRGYTILKQASNGGNKNAQQMLAYGFIV